MNYMIDLETLDNTATSVIVSIGVVAFDEKGIHSKYYGCPSIDEQIALGRTISEDTICWWMKQSETARAVFKEKRKPFKTVMQELSIVLTTINGVAGFTGKVYGNGGDFDPVIIQNALSQLKMPPAWKFWDTRCFRTWCEENNHKYKSSRTGGISHNALADAEDQVNHMLKLIKKPNENSITNG